MDAWTEGQTTGLTDGRKDKRNHYISNISDILGMSHYVYGQGYMHINHHAIFFIFMLICPFTKSEGIHFERQSGRTHFY